MLKTLALSASLCLALSTAVSDDHKEIERAVLDYAESYYEVRPEYIERSIHRDLVKLGYKYKEDDTYEAKPMDYTGFEAMIAYLVENDHTPEPGPKEVEILDAADQTALVKLTGSWGVDYMQLAKFEGKWMTRHALWQTAPRYMHEEQRIEQKHAIEAAVANYVDAIYKAKPDWIERSVDKSLTKYGFERRRGSAEYTPASMSYDQLVEGAGKWYASSPARPDAKREIEVLDIMDKIACAKLTADWGIDYMQLAEIDGRWMILHVMWQSHPPKKSDS